MILPILLSVSLCLDVQTQEYGFACVDYNRTAYDNIDAIFSSYRDAHDYCQYYKAFHSYEIIPVFKNAEVKLSN